VERFRDLLMELFVRVLNEQGRTAPSLRNITVEFGCEGSRLVAVFSDGRRASVAVPREDLYAFYDVPRSLDQLHSALTGLGRTLYAQMVGCHGLEIIDAEEGRHRPHQRWTERLRLRIRRWLCERSNRLRISQDYKSRIVAEREARARGIRLLTENLSSAQRIQYERYGYFEVMGGQTGKRYRITKAHQMNVQEIGKNGRQTRSLCFVPKGGLVAGDVMLAQKLALELFEPDALKVANVIAGQVPPIALLP
jgi:hypothetical protein